MLVERVARRWWTLVVRGVMAIAFGVLTIFEPPAAVMALVFIFGVYAIADGVVTLSALSRSLAPERGRFLIGLSGVLSIAAGVIALFWPGITALALFYLIAFWALVIGIIEIMGALVYHREIENDWALVISGLLWVAFGVILIARPNAGVLAVLALIATFAIVRGVALIVAGVRLRKLGTRLPAQRLDR